jgi:mannose-6-phosphate isomerase-like protein (cupin superfamily)
MKKVAIADKLDLFSDYWSPKVVGELNGQEVKLVKLKGEFVWHKHEEEDELFYVLSGILKIEFKDRIEILEPNEMLIIPRGVEHKPIAEDEVHVMLFEPANTLNTGNADSIFTKNKPDHI